MTSALGRANNPHDIFITLDGSIEMAVRSKKPKTVVLVKWLTKKGEGKIQEEHQHVQEEKYAALALINNDLQDRDNQIQAIQHEKVAFIRPSYKDVKKPSPIFEHVI